jgi:SAM-dependent methyltransferase
MDIKIKTCDIENEFLPYEDESFDIVYSKSLLEHLYYPEKYMKEAYRVLKPNGLLITLVPNWESNYKIYYDDYTHRTPFNQLSLEHILKIHNFTNVNVFKFRQLPINWRYPILNYVSAIIAPFVPIRTKIKFLRWSKELMLVSSAIKNMKD